MPQMMPIKWLLIISMLSMLIMVLVSNMPSISNKSYIPNNQVGLKQKSMKW